MNQSSRLYFWWHRFNGFAKVLRFFTGVKQFFSSSLNYWHQVVLVNSLFFCKVLLFNEPTLWIKGYLKHIRIIISMGKESSKPKGLYKVKCVILYGSALNFNSFFGLFLIHCERRWEERTDFFHEEKQFYLKKNHLRIKSIKTLCMQSKTMYFVTRK